MNVPLLQLHYWEQKNPSFHDIVLYLIYVEILDFADPCPCLSRGPQLVATYHKMHEQDFSCVLTVRPALSRQRCSACCSETCWCSCRGRMTRWSSNAIARVTSPCRRANKCWAPSSSWTRSSSVKWPQVSLLQTWSFTCFKLIFTDSRKICYIQKNTIFDLLSF